MDIPEALLAAFPPSAERLLDRVRSDVDDAMLRDIAQADYGLEADEMFALLRAIRDTGRIPAPMPGQLIEVLELTRWCNQAERRSRKVPPDPSRTRRHQARLFACALLLRASAEPAGAYDDRNDDTALALCLDSAKALGADACEALACFLTWRLTGPQVLSYRFFFALGMLILGIRLRSARFTNAEIGAVADWVLLEEEQGRNGAAWNPTDRPPMAFSLCQGLWKEHRFELEVAAAAMDKEDVRLNLKMCALLLETDWGLLS